MGQRHESRGAQRDAHGRGQAVDRHQARGIGRRPGQVDAGIGDEPLERLDCTGEHRAPFPGVGRGREADPELRSLDAGRDGAQALEGEPGAVTGRARDHGPADDRVLAETSARADPHGPADGAPGPHS